MCIRDSTQIINKTVVNEIRLGEGTVNVSINLYDELFYKVLTEISGVEINNDCLLYTSCSYSEMSIT